MTDNFYQSEIVNDNLDIYADPDISVKILKSKNNPETEIRIQLEGMNVDYSIVNALRRTIDMSIPIYAFHRTNTYIDVEKSRHMYNNDLLYNQIETLPIYDVPNYFDLENPEIFMPTDIMKRLFGHFTRRISNDEDEENENIKLDSKKKLLKIEINVSLKNNTSDFRYVTTHDLVLKIDGKVVDSYKTREPSAIMVLKPTEEIYFRSEANLGISKMHAMYEATTNVIHDEISPTKYVLWYETLEQLEKEVIFDKACIILAKKLANLKNFISKNYEERKFDETVEVELFGENDTLGNLISTTLQKCVLVEKAAYVMPHPFEDRIIISFKLIDNVEIGPIQILADTIEYLSKLFNLIHELWTK